MNDSSVTLKFPLTKSRTSADSWFAAACDGIFYGTESGAKKHFRAAIEKRIAALIEADSFENKRQAAIGCGDGTIMLIQREAAGQWGYRLAGPGRKHLSSGTMGYDSLDAARASAADHARQCFGGVVWEN